MNTSDGVSLVIISERYSPLHTNHQPHANKSTLFRNNRTTIYESTHTWTTGCINSLRHIPTVNQNRFSLCDMGLPVQYDLKKVK